MIFIHNHVSLASMNVDLILHLNSSPTSTIAVEYNIIFYAKQLAWLNVEDC